MSSVGEAVAVVRAARNRLVARAVLEGAALGALLGALAGAAVSVLARAAFGVDAMWPLLAPVAGALAGGLVVLGRESPLDAAALTLDAEAKADEAFVTALAATDGEPEFRELAAAYALERCGRRSLARMLPLRAPSLASAAALAAALLAAVVLVPRARAADPATGGGFDVVEHRAVAAASGPDRARSEPASPRERAERLRQALRDAADRMPESARPLAESVRRDLAAVTDEQMRRLAETMLALPDAADAARRSLDALARGDRSAATAALREALGGRTPGASTQGAASGGTGTGTAAPEPDRPAARAWGAPAWPLRYDRAVRRFLTESTIEEKTSR
jgi:hypothetical protein